MNSSAFDEWKVEPERSGVKRLRRGKQGGPKKAIAACPAWKAGGGGRGVGRRLRERARLRARVLLLHDLPAEVALGRAQRVDDVELRQPRRVGLRDSRRRGRRVELQDVDAAL